MVSLPDEAFERLERRRRRNRRNERLVAGVVSMALVGALVAGSVAVLRVRGGHANMLPGGSGPSTVQSGAGNGRTALLPPGQYIYVKETLHLGNDTFSTETWWASDGSGRVKTTCSTQNCVTYASPDGSFIDEYGQEGDQTFGPGDFPTDSDLSGLSTDPTTLRDQLIARTAEGGNSPEPAFSPGPELSPGVMTGSVIVAILNILGDPNGTPDLDAAVFQVASGLPGVEIQTGVTDAAGRPATALLIPAGDRSGPTDYYFDPSTGLLMSTGQLGNGAGRFDYDRGIVDGTAAAPTGDQWLFPPAP